MRIVIDVSAADDPDAHEWLDRTLYRIVDGWHVWDLTDTPDLGALQATSWIDGRGALGDLARKLLDRSTQRRAWTPVLHGRRVRVTANPTAADDLAPEEAFRLADEPLVILVENRDSDGPFVERIVKELDKRQLGRLWERGGAPIRFDSVGGAGQMPQEVDRRAHAVPYRPRLAAVIDSDRKGPGGSESENARRIRETCDRHRLPCWVLAKREAENYLPRVLLSARPDAGAEHQQRLEAWNRLNDDQKDFFDMKHGLPRILSQVEQNLFDDLPDADREILARGFGPNIHECWNLWHVREVRDELRIRGRGDPERGIEMIRREL